MNNIADVSYLTTRIAEARTYYQGTVLAAVQQVALAAFIEGKEEYELMLMDEPAIREFRIRHGISEDTMDRAHGAIRGSHNAAKVRYEAEFRRAHGGKSLDQLMMDAPKVSSWQRAKIDLAAILWMWSTKVLGHAKREHVTSREVK